MNQQVSEIEEMPLDIPESTGEGMMVAGIHGDTDYDSLQDRARRTMMAEKRTDYRSCIPCDRCSNSLEIRGFDTKGKEQVLAIYCQSCERVVTPFATCNQASRSKSGRKRVIYDLTNAPRGFKNGMGDPKLKHPDLMGAKVHAHKTLEKTGEYRGGSDFYRRADGDRTAEGSGLVPKRLVN